MTSHQASFSPAELAYLHSSLSLQPPIRPDGRSPTQFRPLSAETGILPGTNGSARVCFSDGTEAIVGVKAEIEKTVDSNVLADDQLDTQRPIRSGAEEESEAKKKARSQWLEMTIEIPGQRDDDASTVFLAEMLREALLADGEFAQKLWINRRFHWRLYLDVSFAVWYFVRVILTTCRSSSSLLLFHTRCLSFLSLHTWLFSPRDCLA